MRPRLTTILILLVLGAVVNVGVAWGCAVVLRWREPVPMSYGHVALSWPCQVPDDWPTFPYANQLNSKTSFGRTTLTGRTGDTGGGRLNNLYVVPIHGWAFKHSFGWPRRSLSFDEVLHDGKILRHGALELPPAVGRGRWYSRLPVCPSWFGFAVNTLLYAVILWLPFGTRRLIRARRGLCPACAYPVGESPVCTECGGKLRRAWTSPSAG